MIIQVLSEIFTLEAGIYREAKVYKTNTPKFKKKFKIKKPK